MQYFFAFFTLAYASLLSCSLNAQSPEYGIASVYADRLTGRPTASGELYDMNKFTAAHKTLPFGTVLKVTRVDNDKYVIVKVNDRGPHKEGRIVDLSRAAADQVGLVDLLRVRVEIIDEVLSMHLNSLSVNDKAVEPSKSKERFDWVPTQINTASATDASAPAAETTTAKGTQKAAEIKSLHALLIQPEAEKPVSDIPTEYSSTTAPAIKKADSDKVNSKGAAATAKTDMPAAYDILNMVPASKNSEPKETTATPQTATMKYAVQVASFSSMSNAESHSGQLRAKGFGNIKIQPQTKSGTTNYKVVLGQFDAITAAETFRAELKSKYQLDGFVIMVEE